MANQSTSPRSVGAAIALLLAIGAGGGGVYLADQLYYGPMREQKQLVENLKTIVERLTRDERVAQVMVTEQTANPLTTTVRFQEVDYANNPIGEPISCKMDGDEIYFDTLVIKFDDGIKSLNDPQMVEKLKRKDGADDLAGKSIILFRRIFSDKQRPESGCTIDAPGSAPTPYKTPPTALEQELWHDFWKIANDPDVAKARGIRAAHGEAVSMKIEKDKIYVIEKRAAGDLTIRPEKIPAVMRNPAPPPPASPAPNPNQK